MLSDLLHFFRYSQLHLTQMQTCGVKTWPKSLLTVMWLATELLSVNVH